MDLVDKKPSVLWKPFIAPWYMKKVVLMTVPISFDDPEIRNQKFCIEKLDDKKACMILGDGRYNFDLELKI